MSDDGAGPTAAAAPAQPVNPAPASADSHPAAAGDARAREAEPKPAEQPRHEADSKPAVEQPAQNLAAVEVPDTPAAKLPATPAVELTKAAEPPAVPAPKLPDPPAPKLPPVPAVPSPAVDIPALAPTGGGASNVNVSIRINSPGDDGPVTQIVQLGAGAAPGPATSPAPVTPAPVTWIWNWTWNGAPSCAGDQPAPTPPVGNWTWNWNFSCAPAMETGEGAIDVPMIGALEDLPKGVELPDIPQLGGIDLTDVPLPSALAPRGSKQDKSAADAPESRAGRRRPAAASHPLRQGDAAVWAPALPVAASSPVISGPVSLPASAPRALAPRRDDARRGADTTRKNDVIPVSDGPSGPQVAAASGAAGAGGSGGGPAALETLALLCFSFLVGALLTGVGLPRLKPRGARLERPG